MKSLSSYILALIFATSVVFAQGGSNYSAYGIGDIHNNLGAHYEGLGGVGIAMPSHSSINLKNPALWSFVESTRLQLGYHYNQRQIEQGSDVINQSNAAVNQILGIFSIDTSKGISVAFGILPYSSVNYYIKRYEIIKNDEFDFAGESFYQGSGGVSTAFIGVSSEITNNFRIGLQANAFFGKIKHHIRTLFYDGINQEQINQRSEAVSGAALKGGLFYEPIDNLYIGAYYEKNLNFKTETEIYYDGQLNSVKNDTTFSNTYDIEFPDSYGIGLAYEAGKFLIGGELSIQDFTNFKFERNDNVKFKNSVTAALGLSRMGNRGFRADFLDKITYNFGLGYKQLYYNVSGQDINEIYGSIGLDIPIVGSTMFNTAFTFGIRGKNEGSIISEKFFRMNINLSMGESWFKPFKQDY